MRFGATNRANHHTNKIRVIFSCLVSSIIVLIMLLIFVVESSPGPEIQSPASVAVAELVTKFEILVAKQRIEQGVQIGEEMLALAEFRPEQVPPGAVFARDRLSVVGSFAKEMIPAGATIGASFVTRERPLNDFTIPEGMRAITIPVDIRSSVEGKTKPNSRVDVMFTFDERGEKKIATIVTAAKVLSCDGDTKGEGSQGRGCSMVTLLVREADALSLELARQTGTLSLSLLGDTANIKQGADSSPLSIKDVLKVKDVVREEPAEGTMIIRDPKSGIPCLFELRNSKWHKVSCGGV